MNFALFIFVWDANAVEDVIWTIVVAIACLVWILGSMGMFDD